MGINEEDINFDIFNQKPTNSSGRDLPPSIIEKGKVKVLNIDLREHVIETVDSIFHFPKNRYETLTL